MFGFLDIWLSLDIIISFDSKFVVDMDSETSSDVMTSLDLHLSSETIATSVQPDFLVISDSQPSLIDIDSMVPHEHPDDVTIVTGPPFWLGM